MFNKNKKGFGILAGMMFFILGIIVMTILAQPMREIVDIQRDAEHLDCANTTISTGTRATCLIVDLQLPYFVGVGLIVSGAFLVAIGKINV